MKVLLDESLPRSLKSYLSGHDVQTVPEMGWAGVKNGELLQRASEAFEVFFTADQNLQYQQPLHRFDIAVLVLSARSNRLADLADFARP